MTHLEGILDGKRSYEKSNAENVKVKRASLEPGSNIIEKSYSLSSYNIEKEIVYNYGKEHIYELYPWQGECLNALKNVEWEKGENFIYVAPTSGGKTLISEIFSFEEIKKKRHVFFLFPLNSLINEKMEFFRKVCKGTNIRVGNEIGENDIILCTYEKLNSYLNKKKLGCSTGCETQGAINGLSISPSDAHTNGFLVVVDEFHLIGEKGRGIYIENIISKILYLNRVYPKIKVICMSGTLNNLPRLTKWLNAKTYVSSYRPQQVKEHYICNGGVYEKGNGLSYSYICDVYKFCFSGGSAGTGSCTKTGIESCTKTGIESCTKTGIESCTKTDIESCTKMDIESCTKTDIESCTKTDIESCTKTDIESFTKTNVGSFFHSDVGCYGETIATPVSCLRDGENAPSCVIQSTIVNFLKNKSATHGGSHTHSLLCLVHHSLRKNLNTLIFCPTKRNCEFYINLINEFFNTIHFEELPEEIKMKRKRLNDKIYRIDKYTYEKMYRLIDNGICYYYSDIGNPVKRLLECAYKEKTIFLFTCTSTLSVGLNLLVDRVLISSPFIAQNFLTITQYKQMIGRAARLKKGDSFLLVEKKHEEKMLETFKENFTNIRSTMHNDSLEEMEKYLIEFFCLMDRSLSLRDVIYALSFSLFYAEVVAEVAVDGKEADSGGEKYMSTPLTSQVGGVLHKYVETNLHEFTKRELLFYERKREEIIIVLHKLITHKCVDIENEKIIVTNFCKALCVSNFTISFGIELLEEVKSYNQLCLYNNFHLCYFCASYNINIASFTYYLPFLKNLLSVISHDRYTTYVIFHILQFDSDIINMLNLKNQHVSFNKNRKVFFSHDSVKNKYNKLYLSILLFLYLIGKETTDICALFKITQDVFHTVLQHTYIHIHLMISFLEQLDWWIMAGLLKTFLQRFRSVQPDSTSCRDRVPLRDVPRWNVAPYFAKGGTKKGAPRALQ
ncbi:DEAD/DEAH box helicase, putative [Plasmodium ovale]|uniref:DEAD/DEAH box helicase, putative n=1 Tax=Plasmodium ovale TaxID=36330 RepID=A0A1D3TMI9_PLAOA|nr:DEAD/DEAH box helicase, putative [Plasmodium ovale]